MLSVFIIVSLMTWCLIKYISYIKHMESYLKNVKTRQPWIPYIGNLNILTMKSYSDHFKEISEFVLNSETPLKANVGPIFQILLDKPEDVKSILMSSYCLDKPYHFKFFQLPLGLLTQTCKTVGNQSNQHLSI